MENEYFTWHQKLAVGTSLSKVVQELTAREPWIHMVGQ